MSGDMKKVGAGLVEHAGKSPVTARGALEDLFPFIYLASKRMSTRAISEWLEKENNVRISHNTIAIALRNSSEHFEQIVENVYSAANTLEIHCNYDANIIDSSKLSFLFHEERFEHITRNMTVDIGGSINIGTILHAVQKIRDEWFSLPKEVREQCENIFIDRDTQNYDERRKAEFEKIVKEKISESSTQLGEEHTP